MSVPPRIERETGLGMEKEMDMHDLMQGPLQTQGQLAILDQALSRFQLQPHQDPRSNEADESERATHKVTVEHKYKPEQEYEQLQQFRLRLPLEIEEAIIDRIARSSLRYLLFRLRLVSRRWIPRIDHHLFKTLSVTSEDYIKLLQLLHTQVESVKEPTGEKGVGGSPDCGSANTLDSSKDVMAMTLGFGAIANEEIKRIGQHIEKLTIFTSFRDPSIAARIASFGSPSISSLSSSSSLSTTSLSSSSSTSLTTSPVSSVPPSPFHYERDPKFSTYDDHQDYPNSASYLPHLESLHLVGLTSSEMENIPIRPNLKHIYLRKCTIKLSHIYRIITTARSLHRIRHVVTDVIVDIDKVLTDINANVRSQNALAAFGLDCTSLTDYSADFSGFPPPIYTMDTFLLPDGIVTPSLRNLSLQNIQSTSFTTVKRLIHASYQTLETLEFSFERYGDMTSDGRLRESLDLSQCTRLKHVTIDSLKHDSSVSRRNGLESAPVVLEFLPSQTLDITNGTKEDDTRDEITSTQSSLTISLHFPYEWQQGFDATREIDRVLAANPSVNKVEIILGVRYSDNSEIKAKVLSELPRLSARGIVEVCTEEPLQFSGWVFR